MQKSRYKQRHIQGAGCSRVLPHLQWDYMIETTEGTADEPNEFQIFRILAPNKRLK